MFNPQTLESIISKSILIVSLLFALLLLNYLGQEIIDKKEQVFYSAYFETTWYNMSPKHQRWIYIILICSTDCSGLSAGKIGDVSFEAAGIVIFILYYLSLRKNLILFKLYNKC